jgi:hypothetical protein
MKRSRDHQAFPRTPGLEQAGLEHIALGGFSRGNPVLYFESNHHGNPKGAQLRFAMRILYMLRSLLDNKGWRAVRRLIARSRSRTVLKIL